MLVQVRVAVFAKGNDAATAAAAGADIVGGEDLLASVLEGEALVAIKQALFMWDPFWGHLQIRVLHWTMD